MRQVLLLACFLICCNNHAQENRIETELSIEEYIRSPYGRDKIGMQFPLIETDDSEGQTFSSNHNKKVTVYNFWHAGCEPCIAEIPMLMKLRDKYLDKVDFIGITFEENEDIEKIKEKYNFDYRQLHLFRDHLEHLGVTWGYPTTVIVCDGIIVYCKHGGASSAHDNYKTTHEICFKVFSEVIEKYLK